MLSNDNYKELNSIQCHEDYGKLTENLVNFTNQLLLNNKQKLMISPVTQISGDQFYSIHLII